MDWRRGHRQQGASARTIGLRRGPDPSHMVTDPLTETVHVLERALEKHGRWISLSEWLGTPKSAPSATQSSLMTRK